MRLQSVDVLRQERLLDLRGQPLVGEVDVVDLHLRRFAVEEVVKLLLGVLADRLVGVEEARFGVEPDRPAVRRVARDRDRALGERLALVVELRQVDVGDVAHPLATWTHAAQQGEGRLLGLRLGAALHGDRTGALTEGTLNE